MNSDSFTGKKITLMGLGLLGRGLGDAKFFAAASADLIITDLKTAEELAPSVAQLRQFSNITYRLGDHQLEDFEDRDLIIRAPNAPLDSMFLAHARERGIPIEMDASLFVKLCYEIHQGVTIVGVTGTRGKSTVTHLIYEMARAAFTGTNRKIHLGGNVKDTATLPLLNIIDASDIVILELDSWQLQGFEEDKISPQISVWTNFMSDHMNYYRGDMDRYFQDKAAIARFQKPGDVFIAPEDVKDKVQERFGALTGTYTAPVALPSDWEIALPGEHNRVNAALAVAAARQLGVPEEIIKEILKTFAGLPGRIELLGEKNGVLFYNDSNSTAPEATLAALRALAPKQKPIVLIAGGSDKQLDFAELASEIVTDRAAAILKNLILFEGDASEKLHALLPKDLPVTMAKNMHEACEAAIAAATPGNIILLSPGATSFGIFKNEYDRGEQFRKLVFNKFLS